MHKGARVALSSMYEYQSSGTLDSWKIASIGHSAAQASQSMHSLGFFVDHRFVFVETFYGANDSTIRVLAVMTDNMGHRRSPCDFSGWIDG